jgi:hypothetical protein
MRTQLEHNVVAFQRPKPLRAPGRLEIKDALF